MEHWNPLIKFYLYAAFIILCYIPQIYFSWMIFLFCFSLFVISFIDDHFDLLDVLLYSSMALLLSFAGRGTMVLEDSGSLYMIYIVSVTYSVDTGGFFGGKFFGKHKLIERISPKKTWEGAIAGFLAGFLVSMGFHGYMNMVSLPSAIIMSIVLSITGQLGDLVFSSIKRYFKVKDFGSLLPGHGGILDRIDSLLINIVMFTFLLAVLA